MKTLKALINKKNISNMLALKFSKDDLRSGNIVTIQDNDDHVEYDCIVILNEDFKCKFTQTPQYSDNDGYLMTYRTSTNSPSWWRIGSFLKRFPIHKTYDNILITNIKKSDIDVTKIIEEKDLSDVFDRYDLTYDKS